MTDFKKTIKQRDAISLMSSDAKHICLYGGSRAGKTAIILYAMIVRACKVKSRHAILRLNFNAVKRSIFLDSFPKIAAIAFPNLKLKSNKSDFYYTFPNGSEVWCAGLDDKERTEKILGTEFSTIFFNEISQIDYSSVQIALTRLAEKNDLKKKCFYDMNPPKKSHWAYWQFEKKLNPSDDEPLKNPDDYRSMLLVPQDNIENIDADYISLLENMPENERNRFLFGIFGDESEGQVYYTFRREIHVNSVIKLPGTIFIAEDFNVNPGASIIFQYINEKFYILDEVFLENSDTYKMADAIKKKGYSGCPIIPDSTGGNRKTSGMSDFKILIEAGFSIIPTFNPFITDRINNVNRLLSSGSIIIDPRCKKLINDLEKVVWKNNKPDQSGNNKMLTHTSDCLGYAAWKLDPLIKIKEQRTIQL